MPGLVLEHITRTHEHAMGRGLVINVLHLPTPFGSMIAGFSGETLLQLAFVEAGEHALLQRPANWPEASINTGHHDPGLAARLLACIEGDSRAGLTVWMQGSDFQFSVWKALRAIPRGDCMSYGDLARQLGKPGAACAVGQAVGRNPVAWLVPCHRVVACNGPGGYRWGLEQKKRLLAAEGVSLDGLR